MRIQKNIINIFVFLNLCFLIENKSLYCQVKPSKHDFFCTNDSVKNYTDKQSDLIKIKKELTNNIRFDIIISSQGVSNSILHIEVIDSLIISYNYYVIKDTLRLISYKKQFTKTNNIDNVKGFYQFYNDSNLKQNSYFKEISVYKNSILVSKFLFENVKKSNLQLPNYKEIIPLIILLNEIEKDE